MVQLTVLGKLTSTNYFRKHCKITSQLQPRQFAGD